MAAPVAVIGPVLQHVMEVAEEALAHNLPTRRVLVPGGTVPWDNACGQLWVRLVRLLPHTPSGRQAGAASAACRPDYWIATVGVGVIRCVATVNDRGQPPKDSRMTDDALGIWADAEALQCALVGLTIPRTYGPVTVTDWSPLGPEGGAAGGEWGLTIKVSDCCGA